MKHLGEFGDIERKEFFSVLINSNSDLVESIDIPNDLYSLIIYTDDKHFDKKPIHELAKALLAKGVRYVIATGSAAQKVEDIFDLERESFIEGDSEVIMTVSFPNKDCEEVLNYAMYSASFYEEEEIKKCLILSLGDEGALDKFENALGKRN